MSKGLNTAAEIETELQNKIRQMQEFQKNTNYVEAETCRIKVQQLKKDFQSRKLFQLQQKHRNQLNDLQKSHEEELQNFNKFWNSKMQEHQNEGQRLQNQMLERHQTEIKVTREELEKQISLKLKESSQLLNLRKMQQHMAKQKNFVEAQKVKERRTLMQKQQNDAWLNARNLKMQTAINKIRHKQQAQLTAFRKKIKTGMDQQFKTRGIQQKRINLKYSNFTKELRMQQDKQVIAHKGQFKSKGGSTSSPTKSKTGGFK